MTDISDLRAGTITSIRAQARAQDRVSIFLDGAFAFGMHRDLLLEFDLAKGNELSVTVQERILRRDAVFRARSTAHRFLAYRDRTAEEIRRRLRRDEYGADVVEDVVYDLESKDLVNDRRFARTYAEGRFRSGGYGPVRVRADLKKKGVGDDAVEAALADVFSERHEVLERAREMARGRWQRLARESDPLRRKKKVYDYLARRGFRYEMIRRVVDELSAES